MENLYLDKKLTKIEFYKFCEENNVPYEEIEKAYYAYIANRYNKYLKNLLR
jgi:hypothetical protein